MGFRIRKSIQIVPGVRMNVSRSGIGYSVGGKGVRVTKHANGRVSRTVSIPGTGISHQQTLRRSTSTQRPRAAQPSSTRTVHPASAPLPPPTSPPKPAKPGLLAPAWEKDLFALLQSRQPNDFIAVARKHGRSTPHARLLAAILEGLLHVELGRGNPQAQERARFLLGWSAAQDATRPLLDFVLEYLPDRTWPVEIMPAVTAKLRIVDDVVLLAVAELHQSAGDLPAAIWSAEQARPTTHAALSLADLYSDAGRHQDVIELTNDVTNADDTTALLLGLRGRAFAQLGFNDAAREVFKEALRVRSRSAAIRHRVLLERAQVDLTQNRKAAARKSIEKVLAEDPSYPGLPEALTALN
ncbi:MULTISPECIES: DUF4236 domain-containing protein [Rhodococcus]|uniref:DUF4236 domain-containing protein n=1 Tax=Rhodococcus opacus TaxID=37919 RepID=A0A076EXU1_RHOOP|nr:MULTISPECIES: DUF4236 domain-containing protein [Rhodococcus]AII10611.1 hypothetical protein EP51_40950 [Rhodococcus opacus]WAM19829.1 DUF4236 domain-containing protein [Rhodococcus sp. JS3073]